MKGIYGGYRWRVSLASIDQNGDGGLRGAEAHALCSIRTTSTIYTSVSVAKIYVSFDNLPTTQTKP